MIRVWPGTKGKKSQYKGQKRSDFDLDKKKTKYTSK